MRVKNWFLSQKLIKNDKISAEARGEGESSLKRKSGSPNRSRGEKGQLLFVVRCWLIALCRVSRWR